MVNVSSYLASQQRRPPAITGKNLWREEGNVTVVLISDLPLAIKHTQRTDYAYLG